MKRLTYFWLFSAMICQQQNFVFKYFCNYLEFFKSIATDVFHMNVKLSFHQQFLWRS